MRTPHNNIISADILPLSQFYVKLLYIETIQPIERNRFLADTIWISETYIVNARFVKSL